MIASCLLASILALSSRPPPEVYAVIVGYNGAVEGLPTLRFADDDAYRFHSLFSGLTPSNHIWLLTEFDPETLAELKESGLTAPAAREPTRTQLFKALSELRQALRTRNRQREAAVYFLYAGHGLHGRFLVKPENAPEAGVTGRELRAAVAELAADRATLLFDSCRSQSLFVERGGAELGPDLSSQIAELERKAGEVRIGVLTAATSDHPTGEATDLRAGYFSHVLASGLAGAADADGDGVVTYGELAAFAAFNTVRLTGQQPWFDPPGGDLGAPVMDHRGGGTRLVFTAPETGRFLIETSVGNRVFVEINKGYGKQLSLALPPGRYRVVRVLDDFHGEAGDVQLISGESSEVPSTALSRSIGLGAGSVERGGSGGYDPSRAGFQSPFTPEVVSALATGYQSAKEPTRVTILQHHALSLSYGVSAGLLDASHFEQGVEIGYRYAPNRFFVGISGAFRTAASVSPEDNSGFAWRRAGFMGSVGASFRPLKNFEMIPWVGAGMWIIWKDAAGEVKAADRSAPTAGLGLRFEYILNKDFGVFLDARFDVTWIRFTDLPKRQPFERPMASIGLEYRL